MNVMDKIKSIDEESKSGEVFSMPLLLDSSAVFIYSSLYSVPLCIERRDFVNGRFDLKKYGIREDFFNYPFYVSIHYGSAESRNSELIDLIPKDIPIVVDADERIISREKKDNVCYCPYGNWIDLDVLYDRYILGDLLLTESNSPVIEINNIDDRTLIKLNALKKYSGNDGCNFRYRVVISDGKSLERVHEIVDHLEDEVFIVIRDDIFSSDQDNKTARGILRNSSKFEDDISKINKKYLIDYNGLKFDNFKHLIDLEKCIDVVLSRIPKNASDLDKVVFMTLFMINHFEYDYENVDKMRDLFEFIKDKKGVCRDYADLSEYLFKRAGVECSRTGNYKEDEEVGHAFNVVWVDGKKTLLDVTWLAEEIKSGSILSIIQSNNFLTDEARFDHEGYLDDRHEGSVLIDRADIVKSILKVRTWKYGYYINKDMLVDLIKKGPKKKEKMEKNLENSMPGYSI